MCAYLGDMLAEVCAYFFASVLASGPWVQCGSGEVCLLEKTACLWMFMVQWVSKGWPCASAAIVMSSTPKGELLSEWNSTIDVPGNDFDDGFSCLFFVSMVYLSIQHHPDNVVIFVFWNHKHRCHHQHYPAPPPPPLPPPSYHHHHHHHHQQQHHQHRHRHNCFILSS